MSVKINQSNTTTSTFDQSPSLPTSPAGTVDDRLATTAFVRTEIPASLTSTNLNTFVLQTMTQPQTFDIDSGPEITNIDPPNTGTTVDVGGALDTVRLGLNTTAISIRGILTSLLGFGRLVVGNSNTTAFTGGSAQTTKRVQKIQAGTTPALTATTGITVTFDVAFTQTPVIILTEMSTITGTIAGATNHWLTSVTTGGFICSVGNATNRRINWIAVGE
jgi:hypothetical protein